MRSHLFAAICLILSSSLSATADDRQLYEGYYWNSDKSAIIELALSADGIEGSTVWNATSLTQTDTNNPDESLRKQPIIGMVFLSDFKYSPKKNRWKGGKVYDPRNGKTYDAKMSLKQNGTILEMRGYIGVALLGRTEKFSRVSTKNIPTGLLSAIKSALKTD